MSTGADCKFYEERPGQWFYKLQRWPYGETYDYDTYGPFTMFCEAQEHLSDNHANPGGWSVQALPGCPHDKLEKVSSPTWNGFTHHCNRCGNWVKV